MVTGESPVSPREPRETLGQLSSEVELLSVRAASLFTDYEGDATVQFLAQSANEIGALAYRIAAAFATIGEGLAQL